MCAHALTASPTCNVSVGQCRDQLDRDRAPWVLAQGPWNSLRPGREHAAAFSVAFRIPAAAVLRNIFRESRLDDVAPANLVASSFAPRISSHSTTPMFSAHS